MDGGIPDTSGRTVYATITTADSLSTVNATIAACPPGQVVEFAAGNYSYSGSLHLKNKSNVVLRGQGDSTFITFTSGPSEAGNIAVTTFSPSWIPSTPPTSIVNWTAGYTQGATVITLSSVSGLSVGDWITLDQLNDVDDWTTNADHVSAIPAYEGCADCGREGGARSQYQTVQIAGISGNDVTLETPLHSPLWKSGRTPQAWWDNDGFVHDNGIEDMKIDGTATGSGTTWGGNIVFQNAVNCWVKNVTSINNYVSASSGAHSTHVVPFYSARIEVRHCYFIGTKRASDSAYGVLVHSSSDCLVEDNVFEEIPAPVVLGVAASGNVVAYNYCLDNRYESPNTFMGASFWSHDVGAIMNLFEGNVAGGGVRSDQFHGTAPYNMVFRNMLAGFEIDPRDGDVHVSNLQPYNVDTANRYWSSVGNVLGYSTSKTATYMSAQGGPSGDSNSIYKLGHSTNLAETAHDNLVYSTFYADGDYDVVTADQTWDGADQTLEDSLYLAAKPDYFGFLSWPPINPASPELGNEELIPAGYRYTNGSDPPAEGGGSTHADKTRRALLGMD